jgi:hypothetical protein
MQTLESVDVVVSLSGVITALYGVGTRKSHPRINLSPRPAHRLPLLL